MTGHLQSERLTYRKFTNADLPVYLSMMMNERIMQHITKRALTRKEGENRFIKVMEQTERHPGFGYFFAFRKEDDKIMGLVKLVEYKKQSFELGYALFPDFWGQKYANEMIERFVQYACDESVGHLTAIVDPDNTVSIKLLTKHGFTLIRKGSFRDLPAFYYGLDL